MKAEFLDALAATCQVKLAAAVIGVDPKSVYALRRRDPEFLREWGLALDQGYQLIETLLLGHVLAGGGACEPIARPDEADLIDVDTGLRLLAAHRASVVGTAKQRANRGGSKPQRASDGETDAAILKKLAAIERHRAAAAGGSSRAAAAETVA
jgi:hypothetical protein